MPIMYMVTCVKREHINKMIEVKRRQMVGSKKKKTICFHDWVSGLSGTNIV